MSNLTLVNSKHNLIIYLVACLNTLEMLTICSRRVFYINNGTFSFSHQILKLSHHNDVTGQLQCSSWMM